jgi:uncharacterized membrane protein
MDDGEGTSAAPQGGESEDVMSEEPVWTFRGVRLGPGEFTTSMVHLFRAEIARANVWRQRLDTTTNWAVIITVAVITVSFSESGSHHGAIVLSTVLLALFLYVEARRYRYYELWSYRVRLMETDFFAAMLVPPFHPAVSIWEALGRRFRRNYMWIFLVLALAWAARVWLQPTVAGSWSEFVDRAAIGSVPGQVVIVAGLVFNTALLLVGVLTLGMRAATGEVLPRYHAPREFDLVTRETGRGRRRSAWFRPRRRRRQLMALIVTDRADRVSDAILQGMNRGVTAMAGRGMYTGEERCVLMCALTVTEVGQIKSLVGGEDPSAFVIVTPAQEILGEGFLPL